MKRPVELFGLLASLSLISAAPANPVAATSAGQTAAEASAAASPPGDGVADAADGSLGSGVRVIPPDPASVARWCNAEQQGAHALAEQLRRREREIDEQGRALAMRAQEIQAAEEVLTLRLTELQKTRDQIEGALTQSDAVAEKRIADLVKMVEASRANAAAPIIAALDPALAVRVLERMNTQKAGKLLAELPPVTAARLAERFTTPISIEAP